MEDHPRRDHRRRRRPAKNERIADPGRDRTAEPEPGNETAPAQIRLGSPASRNRGVHLRGAGVEAERLARPWGPGCGGCADPWRGAHEDEEIGRATDVPV